MRTKSSARTYQPVIGKHDVIAIIDKALQRNGLINNHSICITPKQPPVIPALTGGQGELNLAEGRGPSVINIKVIIVCPALALGIRRLSLTTRRGLEHTRGASRH